MSTRAGVDVGGTFTDVVVMTSDGGPRVTKVPTTPEDQSEGVASGLSEATTADVELHSLAHGTTTATNAILERDLDRAVLVTTAGFADVLEIGRQQRPSLYDLSQVKPPPIIDRDHVVTVDERVAADGTILTSLADAEVTRVVDAVTALDPDAVAICLLFSWVDASHEQRLARALAERMPDVHVTVSAELVGSIREFERASTCALNAAVGRTMSRYLSRLQSRAPEAAVTVMTSQGGTATSDRMAVEPVHTLLSGPAGGVVAAAAMASAAGWPDAIAFDMGGTSTDVCLIRDGQPEVTLDGIIDGLPIGTPTIAIHTVGAGGGSIASIDAGGALQVGPRSAGAVPGPVCYGRGGTQPTVTDAHAVLGHLDVLAGGSLVPDLDAARTAFDQAEGVTASGVLHVIRAAMARALRRVSTEAGVDPRGLALVAFGGAGPLHASALARMLGCPATILAPTPGVLSAVGLLLAPQRREWARSVLADPADLPAALAALRTEVAPDPGVSSDDGPDATTRHTTSAADPGVSPDTGEGAGTGQEGRTGRLAAFADLRYAGQAHELRIPVSDDLDGDDVQPPDVVEAFHVAHEQTYGYRLPDTPVVVVTVRLVAERAPLLDAPPTGWDLGQQTPPSTRSVDLGDGPVDVPVIARATLVPGDEVEGPAVLTQPDSTALLLPGDRAEVRDDLTIVVHHPTTQGRDGGGAADG